MLLLFVREGLSLERHRREHIPALPAAANQARFTVIPVAPAARTTL